MYYRTIDLDLNLVLNKTHASRTHTVLLAAAKSRTLEPLAFDEYRRFDTTSFASRITRASLYPTCERSSIKTEIFIEI